jgi:putative exporter of polyketide antibiotics
MVCAFTVLLSTLFSNTAGFTRLWADMLGICRLVNANNERIRLRIVAVMSWLLPAIWSLVYVIFQKPLYLVIFMGISNALFLLVVAYQALIFRYRHTEQRLRPSPMFDVALWLSILSISFMAWRAARSVIN